MMRRRLDRWHHHPGVRSDGALRFGERAADALRNGMGSWAFVFAALGFLAAWMGFNRGGGFDPYPFILLNLVLSCLAALQGAILLIAAKRSDQIASELARHDYESDLRSEEVLRQLAADFAVMSQQHAAMGRQLAELAGRLPTTGSDDGGTSEPAA